MSVQQEIAEHRRLEAFLDRENERGGRVQNALMAAHPGDLRLCPWLPHGTWAKLPPGWHIAAEIKVTPMQGIPPEDIKGPVGVSPAVAERILEMAK